MENEIKVNREWFERLLELRKEIIKDGKTDKDWLNLLLGYIDSVGFLLKK